MRALLAIAVALAAPVLAALPAGAQAAAGESLQGIERQIEQQRFDQARRAIGQWWASQESSARGDERARALFLRAVLADSAEAAERDLLRLAVEHPQSPHADRALMRLAQSRLAHGDSSGAEVFLERLVTDHPQSGERARAMALLGRREAAPPPPARAPARAPAPAPAQRAASSTTGAARPASPPAPARNAPETPRGPEFTVQVAAFAAVPDAVVLRDSLRTAGFDAFIARVGGSGDTVVRVGSFRDRSAADALATRIRGLGHAPRVVTVGGS